MIRSAQFVYDRVSFLLGIVGLVIHHRDKDAVNSQSRVEVALPDLLECTFNLHNALNAVHFRLCGNDDTVRRSQYIDRKDIEGRLAVDQYIVIQPLYHLNVPLQ